MYDIGKAMSGMFATEAFTTSNQGSVASDMDVQVAPSTSASIPTAGGSGGSSAANSRQDADTKLVLYYAAGIIIASIVLLWILGGIVFKNR